MYGHTNPRRITKPVVRRWARAIFASGGRRLIVDKRVITLGLAIRQGITVVTGRQMGAVVGHEGVDRKDCEGEMTVESLMSTNLAPRSAFYARPATVDADPLSITKNLMGIQK